MTGVINSNMICLTINIDARRRGKGENTMEKKAYLKVYTRGRGENYPDGLANSIHIAYSIDGKQFTPFHKNYGILFAKAEILPDDTLLPKGLAKPFLFAAEDKGFYIMAVQTHENGDIDAGAEGKRLCWYTEDFLSFEERGLVEDGIALPDEVSECIELDTDLVLRAAEYWMPMQHVQTQVPESVCPSSKEEVEQVCATAVYSDGSEATKRVRWETGDIDFNKTGEYIVEGRVCQERYSFPLARGYGDPVLFQWEGKWYFIATNDNLNDIGIYVREADTVPGLFTEQTQEHLILPRDEERGLIQTFWAPEFHVIGGGLYILFAVSNEEWGPQCHLMKLKKNGSIIREEDWEDPVRIRKKDGGFLAGENKITLDMTYLKTERASYMVWSCRRDIGQPTDTGSMLYIATVDEAKPWQLTSEPVLLTRPLYGWENVAGTINNEGPYAFYRDGKVYLTYSGGSANSYTYAVGLLCANQEDDLLDPSSWKKNLWPVLSFYSVEGEYGPGHNSFFYNEEGELMISYHAETSADSVLRCDGIRRVHFRKDGSPVFGMSYVEDVNEKICDVKMKVIIKA